MKSDPEDNLLDDILSEACADSFRQALLETTLQAVRRRRVQRQAARVLLALAAAFPALLLVRPGLRLESKIKTIESQPLPPSMMVTTRPGSVLQFSSSKLTCHFVENSRLRGPVNEISDNQLLALAEGLPAALVRDEENQERLVFSDSTPEQEEAQ